MPLIPGLWVTNNNIYDNGSRKGFFFKQTSKQTFIYNLTLKYHFLAINFSGNI